MNGARFPIVPPKYLAVPLSYARGSHLCVARYPLTAAKLGRKIGSCKFFWKNLRKIYVNVVQLVDAEAESRRAVVAKDVVKGGDRGTKKMAGLFPPAVRNQN